MHNSLLGFLIILTLILCGPALASTTCPEMSPASARHRMESLTKDIQYYNRLYYQESRSVISDAEYDRLFAELVRLEECFPAFAAEDSPTRKVGSADDQGNLTVKHERPMLSLSSSTEPDAVKALMRRAVAGAGEVRFIVQPKVDGLPVELIYEDGALVSASTRGDGLSGENVTPRVRQISAIPLTLSGPFPSRVVVRGEVYADRGFAKTRTSSEKYATLRHLAAGTLRSQNSDFSALAALGFFPFELVNADSITNGPGSDIAVLKLLAGWGFKVPAEHTRPANTLAAVNEIYQAYLANRDQQPFAMDGIVVKVDDHALRRRLGEGEKAPFWAAAWKFPPASALTTVNNIIWKVGRTGRRTPVAEVEPVQLGGLTIGRVSLHNSREVTKLGIAAGDKVVVGLVGDVIPQVLAIAVRAPRAPDTTEAYTSQEPNNVDACLNDGPGCRDQFLARMVHFTSKQGLNIKGLGQGRLQTLIEAGLVRDIPSLFHLKAYDMAGIKGIGEKTALRLATAIRNAARPNDFHLIAALGINGIGTKTAEQLSQRFDALKEILDAKEEDVVAISGADIKAVKSVREFFRTPGGRDLMEKFHQLGMLLR